MQLSRPSSGFAVEPCLGWVCCWHRAVPLEPCSCRDHEGTARRQHSTAPRDIPAHPRAQQAAPDGCAQLPWVHRHPQHCRCPMGFVPQPRPFPSVLKTPQLSPCLRPVSSSAVGSQGGDTAPWCSEVHGDQMFLLCITPRVVPSPSHERQAVLKSLQLRACCTTPPSGGPEHTGLGASGGLRHYSSVSPGARGTQTFPTAHASSILTYTRLGKDPSKLSDRFCPKQQSKT